MGPSPGSARAHTQVSRLKREIEQVEEDKERARDDAQKAESSRLQLEAELRDLKRQADQQLRVTQVSGSEALRSLMEEKAAVEKRERQAQDEAAKMAALTDAAQVQVGCDFRA